MQLQHEMVKLYFCSTNNQGERGNKIETVKIFDFFLVFKNFFVTFMITNESNLFVYEKGFELINWIFC